MTSEEIIKLCDNALSYNNYQRHNPLVEKLARALLIQTERIDLILDAAAREASSTRYPETILDDAIEHDAVLQKKLSKLE